MNIVMLLDGSFPPDIRVENEVVALVEAGHNVQLLCITLKKDVKDFEVWHGARVYRRVVSKIVHNTSVGALKFPFYYRIWKTFFKSLEKELGKIDVIHAHDLITAPAAFWLKKRIGAKVLLDLHENYPYLIRDSKHTKSFLGRFLSDYKKWIAYEKKAVGEADAILTVVKEMKNRISSFREESDAIFIYQNVLNVERFSSINATDIPRGKDFTLIYAGGLTPARGISVVIRSIPHLDNALRDKFNFRICGEGIEKADLQELAKGLGVSDKVEFLGWVNQNDVLDHINRSNATIIPHLRSEQNDCSSPNKLFQYMFMNRPVISSDCKSLKRVIKSVDCGLTYEYNNEKELASTLSSLIVNHELQVRMGRNGREAVLNRFNVKNEKKSVIAIYDYLTTR